MSVQVHKLLLGRDPKKPFKDHFNKKHIWDCRTSHIHVGGIKFLVTMSYTDSKRQSSKNLHGREDGKSKRGSSDAQDAKDLCRKSEL